MPFDTETTAEQTVESGTILLIPELARLLRTTPGTIRRRLQEGTFPIAPMATGVIDTKLRWWRPSVQQWLESQAPARPGQP